jgi:ferritin-like metal-binding protein YciE
MKIKSLQELLVDELRDLYNAENQLVKALPKMAKAATSPELKTCFEEHLEQTKGHVDRLERVFEELGTRAKGKTCEAMEGLIEEGKDLIDEDIDRTVLDAGLICAAQKVEHYEMAGYGCVRTWARQLGHEEAANLLQETLDEEAQADHRLTQIAESAVNVEAGRM